MRSRIAFLSILAAAIPASAQQADDPPVVTAQDYARAESFLGRNTSPLVFGSSVSPNWLSGDRFWYRNQTPAGHEFVLVDPAAGTRRRAFDHERVAAALSGVAGRGYSGLDLPQNGFELSDDARTGTFHVSGTRYECDFVRIRCSEAPDVEPRTIAPSNSVTSPDGTRAVFIRDHNLWVQDLVTRAERPITTDGVEDYGYGTDNAGWTKRDTPIVLWSPDSNKLATFQHDARGVGEMYLVSTEVGHSRLESWKYPLPEDTVIFRIERVIIDVDEAKTVRLGMPPDQHRSSLCDHLRCRNGVGWADIYWSADSRQLAFASSSRDHKHVQVRVADAQTGVVRDVMEERAETFFESGYNAVNWRFLPESNELIWFSERDDWGHLYLYDLTTGRLKNRITGGAWAVHQLRRVDEETRTLYFTGAGREAGDPYFQHFYSVRMDGSDFRHLTPDSANHSVTLSPSGDYLVDTYSTPVEAQTIVVRDARGNVVAPLEKADISRLVASAWQPAIPFQVKARDGVTDLYGLMFRPTLFDPAKSYPIVNYLYPGPQSGSVGSRSFSASRRDLQSIAELGFIVVEVDAMGTPGRSKSFHEAYYGNMGDNGIPDQIATIRQLAARHPWMDLDRVGIFGHSGGGFAAAAAIMRYPNFYKVAVSQAGNHDNRNYEDDWGEKWQGLLETYEDGTTSYDNQANQLLAENLRGKLLLAHGTMDSNVPPSNTLLLVDALIEANKDFDLIMFPNRGHGFGNEPYMMRRRWDYFVKHLLGAEPPEGYEIGRKPIS